MIWFKLINKEWYFAFGSLKNVSISCQTCIKASNKHKNRIFLSSIEIENLDIIALWLQII
jgi:hypothetical protein